MRCLQLVDALTRRGRDVSGVGEAVRDAAPGTRVEAVDLVDDQLEGDLPRSDLREHRLDRVDLLDEHVLGQRPVDDVEDEIRDERLLERGREPLDQLCREAADEPDRVGHEVALPRVLERARGRVERLEQPVVDGDLGAR